MRVLILSQYFPPDMGGGATRAYNAAKGLLMNGCVVTVVAAVPHYPTGNIPKGYGWRPISIEYDEGMKVIRTFVPPVASKGFARRFLLFLSFVFSSLCALPVVRRVDVVWAANPNVISVFPSLVYGLLSRCPVVQNVDDLWPESVHDLGMGKGSILSRILELAARVSYCVSSAIMPISPAYAPVLVKKYHVDPQKVNVVPAGVDLNMFTLEDNASTKKEKFRVLYIGSFSPAYNFDQVFDAAALLVAYPDIEFVIQGGGELSEVLISKAKQMKLHNLVVIDKIVSRREVVTELSEADVLILPLSGLGSIELGISSKLYEYQAAGKPIICCSSGQPSRYVTETGSGGVVKPGDFDGLAKTILFLKDNPDMAMKLGASGRDYVENNVSIEKIGVQIKRVFDRVNNMGNKI